MRSIVLFFTLCVAAPLLSAGSPQPSYHFEEDYFWKSLHPISFDLPISCTSESKTYTGFSERVVNAETKPTVKVDVTTTDAPTLWKIVVRGQIADVTVGGGDYKFIQNDVWGVASKTEVDLVLVHNDGAKTISTLTINARSATFVHCFSGTPPLGANSATIYWGRCSN